MQPNYTDYKKAFKGRQMPFAFVDLDMLDLNIQAILHRSGDKKIRVASKSIRCRAILDRVLAADPRFQGIMCFTADEAVWLSQQAYDDLLIGYPTWQEEQIRAICEEIRKGKKIVCMLDSQAHAAHLGRIAGEESVILPVCLDADMSSDFPGIHFGVWRSSVFAVDQAVAIARLVLADSHLNLEGFMGYEAQIAGVGDKMPGQGIKNALVRMLKKRSVKEVARRRREMVLAMKKAGVIFRFVNGGGTGSLEWTREEETVNELTVGSGFFASHLFDYYSNFRHQPAAGYAIEIVRMPKMGIYTALGGGYTASGTPGPDKGPRPFLPEGAKLTPNEGAGEVQSPLLYHGVEKLELGDPIFMRHSKSGELCERFNSLLLLRGGKVVEEVPTYRGEGKCFL